MTFELPTGENELQLQITLVAKEPCVLSLVGKDAEAANSTYFNRGYGYRLSHSPDKLFKGEKTFNIPMPMSPENLKVTIRNDVGFNNVALKEVNAVPLKKYDLWLTDEEKEFKDFAYKFSKIAGVCPSNKIIKSPGEQFIALYLPVLKNRDNGEILSTPARINRMTGIMEIAERKFKRYSLFMRPVILFHEFFHWDLDTRSERTADYHAIDWALSLGFPDTEIMYAYTKVFPKYNKALEQREKDNINYIKNWHLLKGIKHAGKV